MQSRSLPGQICDTAKPDSGEQQLSIDAEARSFN
jgi:hypothetical protein